MREKHIKLSESSPGCYEILQLLVMVRHETIYNKVIIWESTKKKSHKCNTHFIRDCVPQKKILLRTRKKYIYPAIFFLLLAKMADNIRQNYKLVFHRNQKKKWNILFKLREKHGGKKNILRKFSCSKSI